MKSMILSDCDRLIKFILFGDEETVKNKNGCGCNQKEGKEKNGKRQDEVDIRHVPCNKLRPGKNFLNDDDLDFDQFDRNDDLYDNEKIKPENNMGLAIYYCKGKFQLVKTLWCRITY